MEIEFLRLKGFRGIYDGLGLEEIKLDLKSLVGEAQLVALAGPNGTGKTTILDNMHPYLVMPSRAGKDGLGRFTYYDHVYLPVAEKELIWSLDGRRLRSQVLIQSGGRKKVEAYLSEEKNGQWVPWRGRDGKVSDGKVATYEAALAEIFYTKEAFFSAQFSPQNRMELTDRQPGEMKGLLADLLGEQAIRELGDKASEVVRQLGGRRSELGRQLSVADGALAQARERQSGLNGSKEVVDQARRKLEDAIREHHDTVNRLAELRARMEAGASTIARRDSLLGEAAAISTTLAQMPARHRAGMDGYSARRSAVAERIKLRVKGANSERTSLERQLLQAEATAARLTAARVGKRRVSWLTRRLEALQLLWNEAAASVARQNQCRAEHQALEREVLLQESAAGRASLRVHDLRRRAGLAGEVPCAGTTMQGECKLLSDANAARPLIPSADRELEQISARIRTLKEDMAVKYSAMQALGNPGKVQEAIQQKISRAQVLQRRSVEAAALLETAQVAAQQVESLKRQIAALPPVENEPNAAERAELDQIERECCAFEQEQGGKLAALKQDLERVRSELGALPQLPSEAEIKAAEAAERGKKAAAEEAEEGLLARTRDSQSLVLVASQIEEISEKRQRILEQTRALDKELLSWTGTSRCMGPEGLIALIIDDAGPAISEIANDLLLSCYGRRFTVSIETLRTDAKGQQREGFEILVNDARQPGQSKRLENMSGGERVWVNQCLVRALALHLQSRSTASCRTLFSDEADGPLDPERKRMFMAMKRRVLALGHYNTEYFVSQTPELAGMADVVIDLTAFASPERRTQR